MGSNPWTYIGVMILIVAGGIVLLSVLSSLLISVASVRHADKVTKDTVKQLEKLLPGKNCGECGCSSCGEYAGLCLNREAVTPCPYCTQQTDMEKLIDDFWAKTETDEPELPKGWRKFGS